VAVSRKNNRASDLMRLGANVRRERVAKGMTQQRLADVLGVDIRSLQRIEAGEINAGFTMLVDIQKALKCSWAALME
jgi:transcriptional regulator with XRE-family HTH domain